MKRILIGMLAALAAVGASLTVAGCSGNSSSTAPETTAATSTAADSATTASTTAPATTAPVTTSPATTAAASKAPTKAPSTTAPATRATQPAQASKSTNNNNAGNSSTTNNRNNNSNQTNNSGSSKKSSSQSSACKPKPKQQSQQPTKAEGSFAASDAVFVYRGNRVALNSDMSTVLSSLGNAVSVESQTSCHGIGEDKTYTYNGFIINTYPKNKKDYVLEVVVSDASISTSKGIHVGSSEADVIAAYGKNYRKVGYYYSYETSDGKSLQFFMEDGVVGEVDYYYNV